jgi:glycosyltransferase involved in cell wall biosynthesis
VQPGENGLLATGAADWEDALHRLHTEPALAARLGEAGRATVEERYSLTSGARLVAETYRLAATLPPSRR